MDFKSIINKISSLDSKIETVAAPELPKAVQLNEDAELRVLAGTSSYIAEAKKCASMKEEEKKEEEKEVEEGFDSDAKEGDTFKTKTGVATKTKTGLKHEKKYDKEEEKEEDEDKEESKTESVDLEKFKNKFGKMVEAKKAKPDFADLDKDGDKKEPMKKAAKEAKGKKVDEATGDYSAKKGAAGKDLGKPGKQFAKIAKKAGKEYGSKEKGEKVAGAVLKNLRASESAMMPKGKKRPVKESVEQKLSFKDMVLLVQESGGQQQIDPIDKELFAWASRVANTKLGEGMKAEVYAGMVYERMGGVFQMYDVLSESKKKN